MPIGSRCQWGINSPLWRSPIRVLREFDDLFCSDAYFSITGRGCSSGGRALVWSIKRLVCQVPVMHFMLICPWVWYWSPNGHLSWWAGGPCEVTRWIHSLSGYVDWIDAIYLIYISYKTIFNSNHWLFCSVFKCGGKQCKNKHPNRVSALGHERKRHDHWPMRKPVQFKTTRCVT